MIKLNCISTSTQTLDSTYSICHSAGTELKLGDAVAINAAELAKDLSLDLLQYENPEMRRDELTQSQHPSIDATLKDQCTSEDASYWPRWNLGYKTR